MTEKEIKECGEKYIDLLKELSYKLMQTAQVLKMVNSIPDEERKKMEGLLECATNTLFEASLRDSGSLINLYHILQAGLIVTEHNKDIQAIALKYAPKYPHKIKPQKCNHPFSGKGKEFNKISEGLARLSPMIEKLQQYEIKENFHRFKKYHDKTYSV